MESPVKEQSQNDTLGQSQAAASASLTSPSGLHGSPSGKHPTRHPGGTATNNRSPTITEVSKAHVRGFAYFSRLHRTSSKAFQT